MSSILHPQVQTEFPGVQCSTHAKSAKDESQAAVRLICLGVFQAALRRTPHRAPSRHARPIRKPSIDRFAVEKDALESLACEGKRKQSFGAIRAAFGPVQQSARFQTAD
jgi:hypothetical protein